jgi:hypothetical protein
MNVGQIFAQIVAAAKLDEEKALVPLIGAAATNIAANPVAANFVVQGTQLLTGIIAAQPNIGQDLLKDLAAQINTDLQGVIAAQPTVTAAKAAASASKS